MYVGKMKHEFGDAHCNMLINPTTTFGARYHNVNAINDAAAKDYHHDHAKALINLANATKSNRSTLCDLVNANSYLTTQLVTVT